MIETLSIYLEVVKFNFIGVPLSFPQLNSTFNLKISGLPICKKSQFRSFTIKGRCCSSMTSRR